MSTRARVNTAVPPPLFLPTRPQATWHFAASVYAHGAGYSDVHVLHTAAGVPYVGVLFQRTLYEANCEGGCYNLALASVPIPPAQ